MKWLKWIAITVLGLLLLIVATISPWGTHLLLGVAGNSVQGLQIEREKGGLWGTLHLEHITYNNQLTQLTAKNVQIELSWSCLLAMQVCIEKLSVGALQLNQKQSTEPAIEDPQQALITLPIEVSITEVAINQVDLQIENTATVKWQRLRTKISMFQSLNLDYLEITQPQIILLATQDEPQSADFPIEQIAQWQYQPIQLAPLFIPINLSLKDLTIDDFSVVQGQQQTVLISSLESDISIQDSTIELTNLILEHALASAHLEARIEPDFHHEVDLRVQTKPQAEVAVNARLELNGSLSDTHLRVLVDGDYVAELDVKVGIDNPSLPVELLADWQQFELPAGETSHQIKAGKLSLEGDLNNYIMLLEAGAIPASLPPLDLVLQASGNNRQIEVEQAQLDTLNGKVTLAGQLNIKQILSLRGNLALEQIQPNSYWPEYTGNISGDLPFAVEYANNYYQLAVSKFNLSGNWLGYPLSGRGEGQFHSDTGLQLDQLIVNSGDSQLSLTGTMDQQQNLDIAAQLQGDALDQIYPGIKGTVQLKADLTGSVSAPQINYRTSANNLSYQTFSLQSLEGNGDLIWNEIKPLSVELVVNNILINDQPIELLSLSLHGNAQDHQLVTNLQSELIEIESVITGNLSDAAWQGVWQKGQFRSQWGDYKLDNSNTEILANWQTNHYQLGQHCWKDNKASLCVNKAIYKQPKTEFDIEAANIELLQIASKFVPSLQKLETDSMLFFSAKGVWEGEDLPTANIQGRMEPAAINISGLKQPINMQKTTFSINANQQKLTAKFDFETEQTGKINMAVKLDDFANQKTLDGTLQIDKFLLKPFVELVPQLSELSGQVNTDLLISGTLDTPLFTGKAKLTGLAFAGEALPGRIDGWDQDVEFSGQSATFKGQFLFGNGKGQSEGAFDWADGPKGELKLKGDNFAFEYRDMLRANFSPDLQLKLTPELLNVEGKVDVLYARVKVKDLPPDAQSPSDDTVILNQPDVLQEPALAVRAAVQINIDPNKTNQVKLDAFGLTTDLRGSLSVLQENQNLSGQGDLNLLNGRYQAYGQDLIIRKGEILFSGPLDSPTLNIEAIRDPAKTENDVIAGLRVFGAAEQPDIEVFSDPAMVQADALAYLLTGQKFGGTSANPTSNEALLASALVNAGLSGSENRVGKIGRRLGIDDLALNASGSGEETEISVSGYIAPGVQLSYGVGVFDGSSKVTLRYQLMANLYLEAVSGIADALDIYYQFSLGKPEEAQDD